MVIEDLYHNPSMFMLLRQGSHFPIFSKIIFKKCIKKKAKSVTCLWELRHQEKKQTELLKEEQQHILNF